MGRKRDTKELEQRRLHAARLLKRGYTQADVARECDVTRSAVSLWAQQLAAGGKPALRRRSLGRPAALDETQRRTLAQVLKRGALAAGYGTELWTLARVAEMIERLHGVRYSTTQVWRLLGAMGWSPQRPARRALERDEAAIARWKKQRWPTLKKTLQNKAE
jgi:transposase